MVSPDQTHPEGAPPQAQALLTPRADEALRLVRAQMPEILARARKAVREGSLGLIGWGACHPPVQKLDAAHEDHPWYFIGDIHGDFLAWHRLLARVEQDPDFRLCFLGDLVDRGPYSVESLASLLDAVARHPDRILWILGNHDEAIRFIPSEPIAMFAKPGVRFRATVEPAEFADWLNDPTDGVTVEEAETWGSLFVELCRRLPRAVLFSDGLLATHGGIPLADRWESLTTLEALQHERVLAFTWTRATSAPKKVGWKHDPVRREFSSGFEFGYKDLESFCSAVSDIYPVTQVVRGHDHVDGGVERPKQYRSIPLLTLNGFGFDYLTNSVHKYKPLLPLGRRLPGQRDVKIIDVPYDAAEHSAIYPAPAPTESPSAKSSTRTDETGATSQTES